MNKLTVDYGRGKIVFCGKDIIEKPSILGDRDIIVQGSNKKQMKLILWDFLPCELNDVAIYYGDTEKADREGVSFYDLNGKLIGYRKIDQKNYDFVRMVANEQKVTENFFEINRSFPKLTCGNEGLNMATGFNLMPNGNR